LGATLNFNQVLKTGLNGALITAISLLVAFGIAAGLARVFKVDSPLSTLIAAGTAICGGSAIAALIPILKPAKSDAALAITIVFLLNATAVWLFPWFGSQLHLSPEAFGNWAALAIHDTSSVVGAAQAYSADSLPVATTLKLTRALWILPLALWFTFQTQFQSKGDSSSPHSKVPQFPKFIFAFALLSALGTSVDWVQTQAPVFKTTSNLGFSLALLMIGLQINREQVQGLQFRVVAYASFLWVSMSILSAIWVLQNNDIR
jgi:uncharacterized integral membrane protein (TIGR00698 family)